MAATIHSRFSPAAASETLLMAHQRRRNSELEDRAAINAPLAVRKRTTEKPKRNYGSRGFGRRSNSDVVVTRRARSGEARGSDLSHFSPLTSPADWALPERNLRCTHSRAGCASLSLTKLKSSIRASEGNLGRRLPAPQRFVIHVTCDSCRARLRPQL